MTPQTHPAYWQSPEQQAELAERAKVLAKAKAGDEEALAFVVKNYGLIEWQVGNRLLIANGKAVRSRSR